MHSDYSVSASVPGPWEQSEAREQRALGREKLSVMNAIHHQTGSAPCGSQGSATHPVRKEGIFGMGGGKAGGCGSGLGARIPMDARGMGATKGCPGSAPSPSPKEAEGAEGPFHLLHPLISCCAARGGTCRGCSRARGLHPSPPAQWASLPHLSAHSYCSPQAGGERGQEKTGHGGTPLLSM